jgi:hypothetical protein
MSPYRITLHDHNDQVVREQVRMFEDDDAAIDHAGRIEHPQAIKVWQGLRLVGHFKPDTPFPH